MESALFPGIPEASLFFFFPQEIAATDLWQYCFVYVTSWVVEEKTKSCHKTAHIDLQLACHIITKEKTSPDLQNLLRKHHLQG